MGWGRSNCSVVICDGEDICGRFNYSSIDMTCLLVVAFSPALVMSSAAYC